jgi:hypothetical protein
MNQQITTNEELINETQEAQNVETTEVLDAPAVTKTKMSKKKLAIIAAAAIAVIAIALIVFIPSEFERVKSKCVHIAGMVTGSGDYFMLDTLPDVPMFPDPEYNTLEAIRYANEEFGFNGSVYSQMMNTTALMGRQSAENDKYRVSWTYHPDDGLEVTYEKK